MEAEMEGTKSFFNEIFLIIGWMVLRELHEGSSLEILTAGEPGRNEPVPKMNLAEIRV